MAQDSLPRPPRDGPPRLSWLLPAAVVASLATVQVFRMALPSAGDATASVAALRQSGQEASDPSMKDLSSEAADQPITVTPEGSEEPGLITVTPEPPEDPGPITVTPEPSDEPLPITVTPEPAEPTDPNPPTTVVPTTVVPPTTPPPPPTTPAPSPTATPAAGTLANISTRGMVGTGDKVMIGGFIVRGGSVKVILRGRGRSLQAAGVSGVLADPLLRLFSGQTVIAENDNWQTGNCRTEAPEGLRPSDPKDACLVMTLAPGPYTAIVSGVGNTTGIAIVEAFHGGGTGDFSNISTRGDVQTGDRVMIGGFIIGRSPVKVVLMGRGPSMAALGVPGVLCNPKLRLYSGQTEIGGNDDWSTGNCGGQTPPVPRPGDLREACLAVSLPPGPYTAIISSQEVCQGIGIVEVFHAGP